MPPPHKASAPELHTSRPLRWHCVREAPNSSLRRQASESTSSTPCATTPPRSWYRIVRVIGGLRACSSSFVSAQLPSKAPKPCCNGPSTHPLLYPCDYYAQRKCSTSLCKIAAVLRSRHRTATQPSSRVRRAPETLQYGAGDSAPSHPDTTLSHARFITDT
ncbi:uncharacterized protein SCHCODRAFT_02617346 [Schizophyllum commune H4-8]|uniref:uncharacterized protein n=1 Tax=Schizophyllum commune (strain H4-8 / FGSC 9210) TaxID=578458 RepID=UPI002160E667|nr:uncharacterized protein SCHCODRAFT_02617346 [Schizophyllum commune H4-8]KAI5894596.1 hypothetical protein SCHCODRAFT_02617346 [Schizophyllum commune H4-8]